MKSQVALVVDATVMIVAPVTQRHMTTATRYPLQRNSQLLNLVNATVVAEPVTTLITVMLELTLVDTNSTMIVMTHIKPNDEQYIINPILTGECDACDALF